MCAEPPTLILQFQYKDHKISVFFGTKSVFILLNHDSSGCELDFEFGT